jgi:hypothetical protein
VWLAGHSVRGRAEETEPALHPIRQLFHGEAGNGMQAAMKPLCCQTESDSFHHPAGLQTGNGPFAPESVVGSGLMQKVRHLIDVINLQVSPQQMPDQMQA